MYKIKYSVIQGDTTYVAFVPSLDIANYYKTHFEDVVVEEFNIHVGQQVQIHDHSDDYHGKIGTVVSIHNDYYLNVAVYIPSRSYSVIVQCEMCEVSIIPTIDPLKSTPLTL